MKKNQSFILLILLFGIAIAAGYYMTQQTTFTGNQYNYPFIAKPVFGSLSCIIQQQADSLDIKNIALTGNIYQCPVYAASSCKVRITAADYDTILTTARQVYCKSSSGYERTQGLEPRAVTECTFNPGETISIFWQRRDGSNYINVVDNKPATTQLLGYTYFRLSRNDVISGSGLSVNYGCTINSNDYSKEIQISDMSKIKTEPILSNTLTQDQVINYVAGWVLGLSDIDIETYNGQEAYCITGNSDRGTMYKVGNIVLRDGSNFKIVSLEFNDIIGSTGGVDCCNGNYMLNQICQNHKWVALNQAECTQTTPGVIDYINSPTNELDLVRYSCVNGKLAIVDTKTVECKISQHCMDKYKDGNDYICSSYRCVKVGEGSGGEIIVSTKEDCDKSGGQWILETAKDGTKKEYCKTTSNIPWDYILYGLIGLLVLILIISLIMKSSKKKKRR